MAVRGMLLKKVRFAAIIRTYHLAMEERLPRVSPCMCPPILLLITHVSANIFA